MAVEISRRDIPSDEIAEYRSETRFLKLPVPPYLDLLNITPLPSQIAIINAINNPKYRFVSAAVSRRQGKTYIANIIGQLVSLVPGSNILIMSPNYSLSQISFDLQRNLIKHFDLEVTKDNAKDKVIEISNGSTVRMGSINQVDSCVGRSYDLIIFDEAALADGKDAFNVALRPTLDKDNSKAIFISTPRGRNNWFSEFFYRGFSDEFPEWCSIRATYKDNPRMSETDIAEARKSMSEAEFRQEYEADFNTYEGQIWKFNFETQVKDFSQLDTSKMDVFAGLDVGYKDPQPCVLLRTIGIKNNTIWWTNTSTLKELLNSTLPRYNRSLIAGILITFILTAQLNKHGMISRRTTTFPPSTRRSPYLTELDMCQGLSIMTSSLSIKKPKNP